MPTEEIIDQTTKTSPDDTDWLLLQENTGSQVVKKISYANLVGSVSAASGLKRYLATYTGFSDFPAPVNIGENIAFVHSIFINGILGRVTASTGFNDRINDEPWEYEAWADLGANHVTLPITWTWDTAVNGSVGPTFAFTEVYANGDLEFRNTSGSHTDPCVFEMLYMPSIG